MSFFFILLFGISHGKNLVSKDTMFAGNRDSLTGNVFQYTSFVFEQKLFTSDFHDQLNQFNNYDFKKPCQFITIQTFGNLAIGRSYFYPGYLSFSWIIPRDITVNDSVPFRIRGFNTKLSLIGLHLVKKKITGIFITAGGTFGRMKLKGDNNVLMKNTMTGPFAALVFRFTVSKINFLLSATYEHDLTTGSWFQKNVNIPVSPLKQSGLLFSLGVNFGAKML